MQLGPIDNSSASGKTSSTKRTLGRLLSGRAGLILITVAGLMAFSLSSDLQEKLGLVGDKRWFVDSYALLASSDAVQMGLDPAANNPLDIYHRPHSYSSWWFGLAKLGLTREQNFLLGGFMMASFLIVAWLNLAPRSRGEMLWQASLLLSPPVLLAVNRGNNELLVFALMGLGLWWARRPVGMRPAGLILVTALATGLKFFPVVAMGALVVLRPARRGVLWAAAGSVIGLMVFVSVMGDLARAVFPDPVGLHLFGSPVFWKSCGVMARAPVLWTLVALVGGIVVMAGWKITTGLTSDTDDETTGERLAFAAAALLLLACFAAGISFAYRWIVALWLAPWLWTRMTWGGDKQVRLIARITVVLLTVVLWQDGAYCYVVNNFFQLNGETETMRWMNWWMRVTQPLVWILMMFLGGWMLDTLWVTARNLVNKPSAKPAA